MSVNEKYLRVDNPAQKPISGTRQTVADYAEFDEQTIPVDEEPTAAFTISSGDSCVADGSSKSIDAKFSAPGGIEDFALTDPVSDGPKFYFGSHEKDSHRLLRELLHPDSFLTGAMPQVKVYTFDINSNSYVTWSVSFKRMQS